MHLKSKESGILYSVCENEESVKLLFSHLPKEFDILVTHDMYLDCLPQKERGLQIKQRVCGVNEKNQKL